MELLRRHVSRDGTLVFLHLRGDDGDEILAFEGASSWHTHPDVLAEWWGVSAEEAVRRFMEDLLGGRYTIVVSKTGAVTSDIWVTDSPETELELAREGEDLELRHWDTATFDPARIPLHPLD